MLTACYDLAHSPASFDVLAFLLRIEAERIERKELNVRIVILPGPNQGFRIDRFWPHSIDDRRKLLHNVVLPMCHMLPSRSSVQVQTDRSVVLSSMLGFGRPLYGMPLIVSSIAKIGRPLRPRTDIEPQPRLVTITLREGEHWPTRNSNLAQWIDAAIAIRTMGYDILFVRDTYKAEVPLDGFVTDAHAATDLDYRAALYRSAFCNFFVSNGPAWLAMALDAPAIIMKPTTDGLLACYTKSYMVRCGLKPDEQLANCPPHQRIVWKDDNAADIIEAFENFVAMNRQDQRITA